MSLREYRTYLIEFFISVLTFDWPHYFLNYTNIRYQLFYKPYIILPHFQQMKSADLFYRLHTKHTALTHKHLYYQERLSHFSFLLFANHNLLYTILLLKFKPSKFIPFLSEILRYYIPQSDNLLFICRSLFRFFATDFGNIIIRRFKQRFKLVTYYYLSHQM